MTKMTAEQKRRARHTENDGFGVCKRCGCGMRRKGSRPYCPPGFWMNAEEVAAWTRAMEAAYLRWANVRARSQ